MNKISKKLHYINYYIQLFSILVLSVGVISIIFNSVLDKYDLEWIGGVIGLACLFYSGVYQLIVSAVSLFLYGKRSVFWKHFIYSLGYFLYLAVLMSVANYLGFLDNLDLYGDYRIIAALIFFGPAIVLLIQFYNITFTTLNPYKPNYNEKNQ